MVTAEQVPGCALPSGEGRFELSALGDFDAGPNTSDSVTRDQRDTRLAFPENTLAVSSSALFHRSSQQFTALADYHTGAQLPLLFWPQGRVCALSNDNHYLTPGGGQGIGYLSDPGLVMLAGSNAAESAAVTGALLFDARTADVSVLPAGSDQLREPRAFASVTAFGFGFLVAGGEDPTITFPSGRRRLRQSAEVFVLQDNAFDVARQITLLQPRSRHAAFAVTPKRTLLVGGLTASEAGEEQTVAQLELVDHDSGLSRHVGLLNQARIAPNVVQLSDGDFFVSGGYDLEQTLVPSAEWVRLQADGSYVSQLLDSSVYEARVDQALVAMPGGAVLAAGGCQAASEPGKDCAPCRSGCPPSDGYDAFWIAPDARVTRFALGIDAARPLLIEQADGAPLLVVPDTDPSVGDAPAASYRFDPWAQAFVSARQLELPPDPDLPLLSLDAGLTVWVSEAEGTSVLAGQRSSTRGPFAQDLELITQVSPTNSFWPLHLAPGQGGGRGAGTRARLTPSPTSDGAHFVLELSGPGSVWVTDARYRDFRLEVTLLDGSLPELALAATGARCRWPATKLSPPLRLWATRRQQELTLGIDSDGPTRTCQTEASGRVELGLSLDEGLVLLSQLRVSRNPR